MVGREAEVVGRGRKVFSGGAAFVAVAASLAVGVEPAAALSCAVPKLDEVLERGNKVAVVTRVGENGGGTDHYRVLAQIGDDLPAELSVSSGVWDPQVLTGGIAVVVFDREDGRWIHVLCAEHVGLAAVVDRIQGEARAAKGGAPVAYAGGSYGSSRVAALDADGKVVAWDRKAGTTDAVAVCPGGRTVVSVGHARHGYDEPAPTELTVHDGKTLEPQRTVVLETKKAMWPAALRCADPDGDTVDMLVAPYSGTRQSRLLTVDGNKVEERGLGEFAGRALETSTAVATDEGFLLGFTDGADPALALIDRDGRRERVVDLGKFEPSQVALSPDERTVAVYGGTTFDDLTVRTVDLASGETLGELPPGRGFAGMGWTESGSLLIRESASEPAPNLARYDRSLREQDLAVGSNGWKFTTVGEDAVSFGATPLRVTGFGAEVESDELRLADTEVVVGAPDKSFALDAVGGDGGSGTVIAVDPEDGNTMARAVGGVAAGGALAIGAAFVVHRRRGAE